MSSLLVFQVVVHWYEYDNFKAFTINIKQKLKQQISGILSVKMMGKINFLLLVIKLLAKVSTERSPVLMY